MRLYRKILSSRSGWNAAASYFSFASVALWGFLSIPVAVAFLDKEQLGIWAVVNAIIGYIAWMDLGVGNATGRLIAKSVADGDTIEMNGWWSVTRVVLLIQAGFLLLAGIIAAPLITKIISPSELYIDATTELLWGTVLVTAAFFPIRGIPGLLTAQQRFYWVPVIAGIAPWFNLLLFYWLLTLGLELRSYLIAYAGGQALTAALYVTAMHRGPYRPKWDRSGISKARFRALFEYSSKVTVVGLVESVVKTLPTMIIAKAGGLSMVPVYHFSSKAPLMGYALASRMYQSFYPTLLRQHVTGDSDGFEKKYFRLGQLTLGVGMIGAGFTLVFNKPIILILTNDEFYPGDIANTWFSVSLITYPLSGLLMVLVLVSGVMGKIAWIYMLKIIVAIVGGYFSWRAFGMAGIIGFFAMIPLIGGVYGYVHGAKLCGTASMQKTCRTLSFTGFMCFVVILFCGYSGSNISENILLNPLSDLVIELHSPIALALYSLPTLIGCMLVLYAVVKLIVENNKH